MHVKDLRGEQFVTCNWRDLKSIRVGRLLTRRCGEAAAGVGRRRREFKGYGWTNTAVKLLLGRHDVDVNLQDASGHTPLDTLDCGGKDARQLLARNDMNTRTPLSFAARDGPSTGCMCFVPMINSCSADRIS
jgi:hypothetical protein